MRKLLTLLGILALVMALSGSATAGYWSVTYDLVGSIATTTSPGGVKDDDVTGRWRFEFDSVSKAAPAPYSGARMAAGVHSVLLSQTFLPTLAMALTGETDGKLLPVPGGQPAVISGANLNPFVIPDSETTGFNHCYGGPICGVAGFPGSSIPQALTPTGPGPFPFSVPTIKFGATAGVGNWTSDPKTDIVGYTATNETMPQTFIVTNYVGTEVSRYYITGDVPALGGGALMGLAAFLLVGGTSTLALRNRRS